MVKLEEFIEGVGLILLADMSILASLSARMSFAKWEGSTAEDRNYSANMVEDKGSLANQIGTSKDSE